MKTRVAIIALSALAVLGVLGGCARHSQAAEPVLRPGSAPIAGHGMTVSGGPARPGDWVRLTFAPEDGVRGFAFSLAAQTPQGWRVDFYLTSIQEKDWPPPPDARPWWSADETGRAWADVAVSGPGRVLVPDVATPGRYRICTVNSPRAQCAYLDVRS